jgi:hypothetical protein
MMEFFLFTTASRPDLGPTHPPIQWIPGKLAAVEKLSGHDVDHSPTISTEIKNVGSYTSIPQCIFMALYLVKHRENFMFTFYEI